MDKQIDKNQYHIFDTHAHYNDEKYNQNLEEILLAGWNNGVREIVNVGYDIKSSKESIEIAKTHNNIYSAVRATS